VFSNIDITRVISDNVVTVNALSGGITIGTITVTP
jgi:hypothetical protein